MSENGRQTKWTECYGDWTNKNNINTGEYQKQYQLQWISKILTSKSKISAAMYPKTVTKWTWTSKM